MSIDSIADNFFKCSETPIWLPVGFAVDKIRECASCSLRLTSKIAGPGGASINAMGFLVDENPTVSLTIRGQGHNLIETFLSLPGGHRLEDRRERCDAELFLFFQNGRDTTKHACLAIPIDIGPGSTNAYFSTLGNGVQKNRPTVASLLTPTTTFMNYEGADIRRRHNKDNYPRAQCDPVARVVDYYVSMTPVNMNSSDYQRFSTQLATSNVWQGGPPKPATEVTLMRIMALGTRIEGITLEDASTPAELSSGGGEGYDVNAMKCYRLNEDRDVKNGKVYIGGPGAPTQSSLAKELQLAAENPYAKSSSKDFQPGDIEHIISTTLGVLIAILIVGFIMYMIYNNVYRGYDNGGSGGISLPSLSSFSWLYCGGAILGIAVVVLIIVLIVFMIYR